MINNKRQLEIEHRLTTVEQALGEFKNEIVELKENHFAHLAKKVNWILALMIVNAILGIQVDVKQLLVFFQ